MNATAPERPAPTRRRLARAAWIYLAALLVCGTVWMAISPPGIFSDSVSGFMVLRSMEHGAAFNHTLVVDQDDVSKDRSEFTSWWTPGQWLAVWPFTALGLDLGCSMAITTVLAWVIGLAGWYALLQGLGFSSRIRAVSLAVIATQPYVLGWAMFYHGGELLQWACFPWFAALALHGRAYRWRDVVALAPALVVGLCTKSSFLIVGAGALAATLVIGLVEDGERFGWRALGRVARSGVVVVAGVAALYVYVSAGRSPAGRGVWQLASVAPRELLFAAAAPLNSLLDLWKLYIPEAEATEWVIGNVSRGLLLVVLIEALLIAGIVRFAPVGRRYSIFLVVVFGVVTSAFALAYSLDLLISFHARHARIAGLLLVPGLAAWVDALEPRALRVGVAGAAALVCVGMTAWGLAALARDPLARPVGRAGFSHIYADQAAIDAIDEIDARLGEGNDLIAVPWPQLGLEVENARVFDMRSAIEPVETFQHALYFGRVDNLVVIAPAPTGDPAFAEMLARAFRDHRDWRRIRPEVPGYVFLHSGVATDLE